jgi:LacI family transcriptional regulator
MDKKITIYDVAQHADVAISTVSRVLNGSPYVSEKTREKVQQSIEELEFRPQGSARNLASEKPQVVAVAVR